MNRWHYYPPEPIPEREGIYLGLFRYPDTWYGALRFNLIEYFDFHFRPYFDYGMKEGESWKLVAWQELDANEVIRKRSSKVQWEANI